jgi:hypothetical protein
MKFQISILCLFALLFGCSKTVIKYTGLVEISSAEYGDKEYFMKITELERDGNLSTLKLSYMKMGSSVGSSLFIMRGFCEVTKSRGTAYFTNLKEWDDENGDRIYIGGFTNKKNPDIQTEFGRQFSNSNEFGQERIFVSVSQCDLLWGNKEK